jgi:hypothetical protein
VTRPLDDGTSKVGHTCWLERAQVSQQSPCSADGQAIVATYPEALDRVNAKLAREIITRESGVELPWFSSR